MASKEYILIQKMLPALSKLELAQVFMTIKGLGITSEYALNTEEALEAAKRMKDIMYSLYNVRVDGRSRDTRTYLCRLCVAEELLSRGFNIVSVGRCLNRKHASVFYYIKKLEAINQYPKMYQEYFDIKRKFKESLDK